ncbi:FGGY family carbohydrate kinase [uncultured Paenibacillus sp.]|uniref:xylulokinase n=1 Tax=uncultured Paenibacillus sp. TaxID=227322 RepID=UPI0028D3DD4C|nr:FGGY family carbohydrate kinase [uncultured Paenibacillus sp.]
MRDKQLLMGIDIGSTAVKVIAMTAEGEVRASATGHYPTSSPRPGWVEQDPESWWSAAAEAIRACMAQTGPAAIGAVSFSGHMSAPVLLDGGGKPVLPSILIADTRSFEETRYLRETYRDEFTALTGNVPVDAFTVSKLLWIKKHHPQALERAAALLFPKDFIRFKLTGHIGTDATDAGNSLLYSAAERRWAAVLIRKLGLAPELFPPVGESHHAVGKVGREAAGLTGLPEGTPVVMGAADMACSQLGTGAAQPGTLAVTLSTSAQVVLRVGSIAPEMAGRVTFHPSAIPHSLYAMGSVFTGGLGVDWGYRMLTGKTRLEAADFDAIGELSERMDGLPLGSGGLLFLPFLMGSGTPYFDSSDRASWLGLSTGQDPALLLHSVMEGVAYNIRESMEVFESAGYSIQRVHLGGGGSRNSVWCRMIGDVLGKDMAVLANRDASAAGAAILAGVGSGVYETAEAAADAVVRTGAALEHSPVRHDAYNGIYRRYRKVYVALNEFYRETDDKDGN